MRLHLHFYLFKILKTKAAKAAPPIGPKKYNIINLKSPEITIGPNDLAGFKLPPVIGPPANIQTKSVDPMASPANCPALLSTAQCKTELTRKNVNINSITKALIRFTDSDG